jgi:hypothetical protein
MTAAEARLISKNAVKKREADTEIRIRTSVNNILKAMRDVALRGGREMTFAPEGLQYMVEVIEVKSRFLKLGYIINKEHDGEIEWEVISW